MRLMCDSPERDLCDVLVSFFNTIQFKLLKISKVVGGPENDTRKSLLANFDKLSLWRNLKSVITEAFLPCL